MVNALQNSQVHAEYQELREALLPTQMYLSTHKVLFVETDEPSWFRHTLVSKKRGEGHPSSKQGILV